MCKITKVITGIKFQTSRWDLLNAAQDPDSESHREVVNALILLYWKPVLCYIRCKGYQRDAIELTQSFFVHCFLRNIWGRADRKHGRFRNFMLVSLNNFLASEYKHKKINQNRFISIEKLQNESREKDFATAPDAEREFHRVWCGELIQRVWMRLREEFLNDGKKLHLELFRMQVYDVAINGKNIPALAELAEKFKITPKEASNKIITVKRAFRRLLREEISLWARDEQEIKEELDELIHSLAERT